MIILKEHHTPKYILNKLARILWERQNPDAPWLAKSAVPFLENIITKDDIIFETGSGRSTIWLAKLARKVISVEHSRQWYNKVSQKISIQKLTNIDYYLEEVDNNIPSQEASYVSRLADFPDKYFDVILIDGKYRSDIALLAVEKTANAGLIIIDNVDRYLVIEASIPYQIKDQKDLTEDWAKFQEMTRSWRNSVFSDGIIATMVLFNPGDPKS